MSIQFATSGDMLVHFNERDIGQYVRVDGTRATAAELATDLVLREHLQAASSDVLLMARRGRRYTLLDLENLTDNEGRKSLARLVCVMTKVSLMARKGYAKKQIQAEVHHYAWAEQMMKDLQEGLAVFDLDASTAATLIDSTKNEPITGVVEHKLSKQAHRLFAQPGSLEID